MANNLMGVWGTIGSVALAVLILLVMITIHEFGHYLAGKLFKFKIDEFSVGFGPAIFKKKRKKTGELFAVRLIPLGGYCAFHGEDGLDEPQAAAEGGEIVNRAEGGENAVQTVRETESAGAESEKDPTMSAAYAPQTRSDGASEKKRNWNDDGDFTHMKPWKRIVVLVAGAAMNYLLALVLILIGFSAFGQSMVQVNAVVPSEEWGEFSLREGDILLGAEGRGFYLTNDVARAVNNKQAGDMVTFRVSRLQADGTRAEVDVPVVLRAAVSVKNSADFTNVWKALGIGDDGQYYLLQASVYRFGFFPTIGRSFVYSFRLAGSVFRVIGELLTGKLGLDALGGPVTTITMTSQIASQGFRDFLEISALIGVNLAVFNLLPIPALDGSKVVFTAIEWARGKPISRKIEAVIHGIGFLLLIGFAILVDVLQFV